MTAIASLVLAALAFGNSAVASEKDEKDVLAALETYRNGVLKRDPAALEKVFHKDLVYTHSNGKLEDKAEAIKNATAGTNVTSVMEFTNNKVHVYGTTAIVKGDAHTKSTSSELNLSVLYVLLKTPQGWQIAARQGTRYVTP